MDKSLDINAKLKIWLFPSLVTILGTLIWRDVAEMKSDIKALLAQSNIDKTRIDNLERFIYKDNATSAAYITAPLEEPKEPSRLILVDKYFVLNESKRKKSFIRTKRTTNAI